MVVPSPFVCTRVLGEGGLVTRAKTAIVHGTPRRVQLVETPRLTERPSVTAADMEGEMISHAAYINQFGSGFTIGGIEVDMTRKRKGGRRAGRPFPSTENPASMSQTHPAKNLSKIFGQKETAYESLALKRRDANGKCSTTWMAGLSRYRE